MLLLLFFSDITRQNVYEAKLTHRNDEAFSGALAVFLSIKAILNSDWNGKNNLFDIIIPEIPDTNVRDRLIEINSIGNNSSISEISKLVIMAMLLIQFLLQFIAQPKLLI